MGLATPISTVKIAKIENEDPPTDETIEKFIAAPRVLDSKWTREIVYKLEVAEKGYLYKFSSIICDGPCNEELKEIDKLPFNLDSGNYTRTNWPIKEPKPEKKKEEKPTINVSGSIQLPEDKKE